jgi:hypothetical protein
MKRRKFLFFSVLVGFGMVFTPAKSFASGNIIIPLPDAQEHVRHGNLNLHADSGLSLPNGVSNVKFQRFYKDGMVQSADDLCAVTFEFEDETVVVQFKFSELCERGYLDCEQKSKGSRNVFTLI